MFDVLLVVALDVRESPGVNICADIKNFLTKGLSVGIVLLGQGSHPNRYRNVPVVTMAFEMDIPMLGHKDAWQTQLAIVYNPDLFIERAVRGRFAAKRLWVVFDNGQFETGFIDQLDSKASAYSEDKPVLLAVTEAERQAISAETSDNVLLWNFHASDVVAQEYQAARLTSIPERVGIPNASTYGPEVIAELKALAPALSEATGKILCARSSVPSPLQTATGSEDILVGFPFVAKDRDKFLGSLSIYVVPTSMLASGTWKEDVYACLRLGVPLGLPRALQPHFGAAATYYKEHALELFVETGVSTAQHSVQYAQLTYKERMFSKSTGMLLAAGIEVGTPVPANDAERGAGETTALAPLTVSVDNYSGPLRPRVCFVTSNGAGMGHLTRLLAVARRLDDDVEASFVSMSQACGVVAQYGYDFEYIASKGDLLVDGTEWNRYFNKRFQESLHRLQPDVVVFDGTWPYQGVERAIANNAAKFVWMRRGMWRSATPDTSLVRHTGFDSVIEPGDLASPYDEGPTSRACDAYKVEPIIVLDSNEVSSRERAREVLGLGPDENAMLITLGAGNINKIDADVKDVILAVKDLPEKWRIFMTSPQIAENVDVTEGVENISIYPLARFAKAFDFVVSATGYNSFHEWIAYSVPTLWIANANTVTDDQIGRARFAHDTGLGFAAGPGGSVSIPEAIDRLGQHETRTRMREAMELAAFNNGAYSAARHISDLAKGGGNL